MWRSVSGFILHSRNVSGLSDTSLWRQSHDRVVKSLEFGIIGLVPEFLLCESTKSLHLYGTGLWKTSNPARKGKGFLKSTKY